MNTLGIIPARMGSTRFPNKPMALIAGIPMIGHCYFRSLLCDDLVKVYVATCDKEIFDYIKNIGGDVVMTSNKHERATERVAEALLTIEKQSNKKYDSVVMIQGDEPLVFPEMISEVISPLKKKNNFVSNLISRLSTKKERDNPNNVKVVFAKNNNILYLTRAAIPSDKLFKNNIDSFRQLGLIAFKSTALKKFISFEQSKLEIIESVDMNRFLENGINIFSVITKFKVDSVDTPQDLARVVKKMNKDKLVCLYNK